MASKYNDFLDAVVGILTTAFSNAGVTADITREYDIHYNLDEVVGLKLNILPSLDVIDSAADRRVDYYDAEFSWVLLERYASAEVPPKAWLDQRVDWSENLVFGTLHPENSRPLIISGSFGEFWAELNERTEVCDMAMLREHKVFWSEGIARFRKLRS